MARYRGPRNRILRRLGATLPGLTTHVLPEDAAPPGTHGRARKRRKISEYARRLHEKQKLRFHYGVSDRQLRTHYRQALAAGGVTGETLFSLLERRLDNVVFRLGFAPTIPAARQLVSHRHVLVNGRRVNIPSYRVKPGDVISIRPESRGIPLIQEEVQRGRYRLPAFLEKDPQDPFTGRVVGLPRREDVPFDVDESAVLEYYGRR
jgi:small subunit ribosomal protein S4